MILSWYWTRLVLDWQVGHLDYSPTVLCYISVMLTQWLNSDSFGFGQTQDHEKPFRIFIVKDAEHWRDHFWVNLAHYLQKKSVFPLQWDNKTHIKIQFWSQNCPAAADFCPHWHYCLLNWWNSGTCWWRRKSFFLFFLKLHAAKFIEINALTDLYQWD